jgi:hypothetical protein
MSNTIQTITIRNGSEVLAKIDQEGDKMAVTYANNTQADKKVKDLGETEWEAIQWNNMGRAVFVAKKVKA